MPDRSVPSRSHTPCGSSHHGWTTGDPAVPPTTPVNNSIISQGPDAEHQTHISSSAPKSAPKSLTSPLATSLIFPSPSSPCCLYRLRISLIASIRQCVRPTPPPGYPSIFTSSSAADRSPAPRRICRCSQRTSAEGMDLRVVPSKIWAIFRLAGVGEGDGNGWVDGLLRGGDFWLVSWLRFLKSHG